MNEAQTSLRNLPLVIFIFFSFSTNVGLQRKSEEAKKSGKVTASLLRSSLGTPHSQEAKLCQLIRKMFPDIIFSKTIVLSLVLTISAQCKVAICSPFLRPQGSGKEHPPPPRHLFRLLLPTTSQVVKRKVEIRSISLSSNNLACYSG